MSDRPWPTRLSFKASDGVLDIAYDDGARFAIPFELLRVESPSAEVQGHSPDQKKLVPGKSNVRVTAADAVGRYAVRLSFDDGHDSGIFSWDYLRELGENGDALLTAYKDRLKDAGLTR
ncbi:gamma-butyrobetaine hydroxylase-like domain-containing protein [Oceanicaulis sp.]|jgi:DUF971 family protein|uniref:gamma-butyrobetaine hydroxylase-like domain-containing protein n=1 Tax=Oceanicaulis sp. TaxID=1924941 RepID=UPI000D316353